MRRREFITGIAGAATVWPLVARAQQTAMPVIGFLNTGSTKTEIFPELMPAFRRGLAERGFVEGTNVAIEYRWSEGHNDVLPTMAEDLVRRNVGVIAALGGADAALAAKAATSTIPIAFLVAIDPVASGLVASLNRPGGNLTGITTLNIEVGPKRLELLHELLPAATKFALLVNPTNSANTTVTKRDLETAAQKLGLQLSILQASSETDFEKVFASLAEIRPDGLVIGTDGFLISHSDQLGALTLRHAVPTIFQYRAFAAAGGSMSYGSSYADTYFQVGFYTGRLLKGEKPAELPVQQSTKVELIVNLKTAKALGITVPLSLLGRADEVIE